MFLFPAKELFYLKVDNYIIVSMMLKTVIHTPHDYYEQCFARRYKLYCFGCLFSFIQMRHDKYALNT
jgi:hypothetical protein